MNDRARSTMRGGRVGATLIVLAFAVAGCMAHSEIRTGADGLRTFTVIREIDGGRVVCPAFGIVPHGVEGTLQGQAGLHDPVWLETDDGRHLSVVWPEGFTVRFEPDAVLYNDMGYAMARAGDLTELAQVFPGDAKGTFDDPYIASGILFGTCYPYLR
jgi:hypothetical protein